MEDIRVSIICNTYNHKQYIRSALDSFLMQKTNFPIEIIVHDDCSTDGTTEILRDYQQEYSDTVKVIYEDENQYSKGVRIFFEIVLPKVKGKYIAFCEGDDYWTDPLKLQKQVDFLEANPGFVICTHNTMMENQDTGEKRLMYDEETKELFLDDVIKSGGAAYHTSSTIYKKEYALNRPEFTTMIKNVGDYPTAIYMSLLGRTMYLGDAMSVYRYGTDNSWTKREFNDVEKIVNNKRQCISMLKEADKWSEYKYTEIFERAIMSTEYDILGHQRRYGEMLDSKYREFQTENERFKLKMKKYFPGVVSLYFKLFKR